MQREWSWGVRTAADTRGGERKATKEQTEAARTPATRGAHTSAGTSRETVSPCENQVRSVHAEAAAEAFPEPSPKPQSVATCLLSPIERPAGQKNRQHLNTIRLREPDK